MAQKKQVLDKLARNLEIQGESVSRGSSGEVIVEDGSADITISYVNADISPSMLGGVDGTVSPFLGIGQGNPGKLTIRVASATTLALTFTSAKAVKSLAVCASMANSIQVLHDGSGAVLVEVRGSSDMIGMGQ